MFVSQTSFRLESSVGQPPPQALRFSHRKGKHETRVTGDEPPVVSFPPSFARTFSSRERRLGTRQSVGCVLRLHKQ